MIERTVISGLDIMYERAVIRWYNAAETLLFQGQVETIVAKLTHRAAPDQAPGLLAQATYFENNKRRMIISSCAKRAIPLVPVWSNPVRNNSRRALSVPACAGTVTVLPIYFPFVPLCSATPLTISGPPFMPFPKTEMHSC